MATRVANSANHISKPANSSIPPSTPPTFQPGVANYLSTFGNQISNFIVASDGTKSRYFHPGAGFWNSYPKTLHTSNEYGLIGISKPLAGGSTIIDPPGFNSVTYFTAPQVQSGGTLETGNTGTYVKVVYSGATSYYFYSSIFNVWVLVESDDLPYSNLATRAANLANHISKPANAPSPPSRRPENPVPVYDYVWYGRNVRTRSYQKGFFARFENGNTDIYASNGNPDDTVYLNGSNVWTQPSAGGEDTPRSPQNSSRFGLVVCSAPLLKNGSTFPSPPSITKTCIKTRNLFRSENNAWHVGVWCTKGTTSGIAVINVDRSILNFNRMELATNSTADAGCVTAFDSHINCWDTRVGYHNGSNTSLPVAHRIKSGAPDELKGGSINLNSTILSGFVTREDGLRYSWDGSTTRSGAAWQTPSFTESVVSTTSTAPIAPLTTHPSCEIIRTTTANELWCTVSSTLRRQISLRDLRGYGNFSTLSAQIKIATNSTNDAGCAVAIIFQGRGFSNVAPLCWDSGIGYFSHASIKLNNRLVAYNRVMAARASLTSGAKNATIAPSSTVLSGSINAGGIIIRWNHTTTRSGYAWELS